MFCGIVVYIVRIGVQTQHVAAVFIKGHIRNRGYNRGVIYRGHGDLQCVVGIKITIVAGDINFCGPKPVFRRCYRPGGGAVYLHRNSTGVTAQSHKTQGV